MIILLSPAKSMDYKPLPKWVNPTQNQFLNEASELAGALSALSQSKLQKVLGVSETLAVLNYERFQKWTHKKVAKSQPALWAYSGDVYNGVNVESFSKQDGEYAQKHLIVLSGLYGIIRPYDLILPYRLEMRTKLKAKKATDLYEFWGAKLGESISERSDDVILNCASIEYSKAALHSISENKRVVSPIFIQETDDGPRQKALFSKFMRGVMAKWVIQNKVTDPVALTNFKEEGFSYAKELTANLDKPVFIVSKDFSLLGRFTG